MAVNTTQAADRDSLRAAVILGLCLPGDVLLYLLLPVQPLDGATCIQALCGERGGRRYQGLHRTSMWPVPACCSPGCWGNTCSGRRGRC
ncbi:hypothetical protein NH673_03525 [Pseudomonas putida]|uniref:hypothetical protein n=1 Tax=Pseudomonas putida TaxID=303 RepID=UPI0009B5DBCA|nr:hypothetical protein [Pseudomonas putida]USX39433.1 hypothetical protein NH673_03525 [Pseudomonas putida]